MKLLREDPLLVFLLSSLPVIAVSVSGSIFAVTDTACVPAFARPLAATQSVASSWNPTQDVDSTTTVDLAASARLPSRVPVRCSRRTASTLGCAPKKTVNQGFGPREIDCSLIRRVGTLTRVPRPKMRFVVVAAGPSHTRTPVPTSPTPPNGDRTEPLGSPLSRNLSLLAPSLRRCCQLGCHWCCCRTTVKRFFSAVYVYTLSGNGRNRNILRAIAVRVVLPLPA